METNNNGSAALATKQDQPMTIKTFFSRDDIKKKFQELLGKRSSAFITSVLQIVASNDLLSKATPESIYHSAAVAATLDLPLNNALGFAYIVPYNSKQKDGSYKTVAQFQIGYKAMIQLAQRSGQFLTINSTDVREGEIKSRNRLTGEIEFEWDQSEGRNKKIIIGYVAFFKLLNGFEKSLFMSKEELTQHGKKYSQTFKKDFGLWKDAFDAMANKTVIKLILSKYAPLSIEMQKAVITDQAVIHDEEGTQVEYIDNEAIEVDKEEERTALMLQDALNELTLAESVSNINAIQEAYPHLKEDKEFNSACNAKKIALGKQLKAATA